MHRHPEAMKISFRFQELPEDLQIKDLSPHILRFHDFREVLRVKHIFPVREQEIEPPVFRFRGEFSDDILNGIQHFRACHHLMRDDLFQGISEMPFSQQPVDLILFFPQLLQHVLILKPFGDMRKQLAVHIILSHKDLLFSVLSADASEQS